MVTTNLFLYIPSKTPTFCVHIYPPENGSVCIISPGYRYLVLIYVSFDTITIYKNPFKQNKMLKISIIDNRLHNFKVCY